MDNRFDQEFYTSEWQRVLPLGPHGIEPYVHPSRGSRPSARSYLHHLTALVGAAMRGAVAFGRVAARSVVGAAGAVGPRVARAPVGNSALTRSC